MRNLPSIDPQQQREFAIEIVRRLRARGHEALWAGGCVRDQLLGHVPKDYDVATSARPEEVREIFGMRRTVAVGAAFGVISVLGPKPAGQLDVVTFRQDKNYLDGRHPEAVEFSTPRPTPGAVILRSTACSTIRSTTGSSISSADATTWRGGWCAQSAIRSNGSTKTNCG